MRIALDYDETYTLDPKFWDEFIQLAKNWGHVVSCVTGRVANEENVSQCQIPGIATYFTEGAAKQWFMESISVKVDVWIDDDPRRITQAM